jgi:hypothetical protein
LYVGRLVIASAPCRKMNSKHRTGPNEYRPDNARSGDSFYPIPLALTVRYCAKNVVAGEGGSSFSVEMIFSDSP